MTQTADQLPERLFILAAVNGEAENVEDITELGENDEVSLVSLTDAEDCGFIPAWSQEELLSGWIQDFGVQMMSVEIERDILLGLLADADCEYLVLDLQAGQQEFPIEQVYELGFGEGED